jgi:hypothetical protein
MLSDSVACACQLCVATMRLTDFDYSHDFVARELFSSAEKRQCVKCDDKSSRSAAANRVSFKPYEIRSLD